MANNIKVLVFPVKDLAKAKTFYGTFLGVEPYADSPYYVGYRLGELEVGLDPNSTVGPIAYIDVTDIKATLQEITAAGGEIVQEPKDVANGLLIAQAKDGDGNLIGFRQHP
jgi:predicted enzyme related to lactoylglutathione lyase